MSKVCSGSLHEYLESRSQKVCIVADQHTTTRITCRMNLFPLTESFYAGVLYHTSVQPPGQNCESPGLV